MLSDSARATLENALVPLKAMFWSSLTTAVVAGVGAIALPYKPAEKAANLMIQAARIGIIASALTISVQQLLIWDSRKRLAAARRQYPEVEAEQGERASRPASPLEQLRETASLFRPEQWIQPETCRGCVHYHGAAYHGEKGVNQLICAMHPYGPDGPTCPDKEGVTYWYLIVRIQGATCSNLFFIRHIISAPLDATLASLMAEAVAIHPMYRDRLMKKYKLKSATGLPGCRFGSKCLDIHQAFQELINSCPLV